MNQPADSTTAAAAAPPNPGEGAQTDAQSSPDTGPGSDPGIRPVTITPTYNNAETLPDVLARCTRLRLPLIVVNDGSTDATAGWLATWAAETHPAPVTVETHTINRGKAAALQTGFAAARARGFTHAVTIDTDGQLNPEEIPDLLAAATRDPDALIIGARDANRDDYPGRSRLGRRMSNWAIWLETGVRVEDCQCGLRVYPLHVLDVVQCRAGRFAFEVEVITRAIWAGAQVVSVPVTCRYFEGDARVSHLKPVRDTLHGLLLHSALLLRCAVPTAHRRFTPFATTHH